MTTEAEMQPQVKELLDPPEAGRSKNRISSRDLGGTSFQVSGPRNCENTFLFQFVAAFFVCACWVASPAPVRDTGVKRNTRETHRHVTAQVQAGLPPPRYLVGSSSICLSITSKDLSCTQQEEQEKVYLLHLFEVEVLRLEFLLFQSIAYSAYIHLFKHQLGW